MKRHRLLTLGALMFALVVPATLALAQRTQPTAEQRQERAQKRLEHARQTLTQGLNLTDSQRQAFTEAMSDFFQQAKAWHEDHRDEISDLRDRVREAREDRDREGLRDIREQMKALHEDRPKLTAVVDDLEGTLDDNQIARLKKNIEELRDEHRERLRERHGDRKRGPRGGGGSGDE